MLRPALALLLALLVPLAAAAAPGPFKSVEAFARAIGLKEGGWHTSIRLTALDVEAPPAADPAVAAALKAQLEARAAADKGMDECTGAASGVARLPGILLEKDCTFSRLEGSDGRWALASTCKVGQGLISNFVAQGAYSSRRVTGRHEVDLMFNGAAVHMKIETQSRFVGECRPPAPISLEVRKPN
ncbi:MAG: DUF3617 family protein [Allosphingosinicella sp.]